MMFMGLFRKVLIICLGLYEIWRLISSRLAFLEDIAIGMQNTNPPYEKRKHTKKKISTDSGAKKGDERRPRVLYANMRHLCQSHTHKSGQKPNQLLVICLHNQFRTKHTTPFFFGSRLQEYSFVWNSLIIDCHDDLFISIS